MTGAPNPPLQTSLQPTTPTIGTPNPPPQVSLHRLQPALGLPHQVQSHRRGRANNQTRTPPLAHPISRTTPSKHHYHSAHQHLLKNPRFANTSSSMPAPTEHIAPLGISREETDHRSYRLSGGKAARVGDQSHNSGENRGETG